MKYRSTLADQMMDTLELTRKHEHTLYPYIRDLCGLIQRSNRVTLSDEFVEAATMIGQFELDARVLREGIRLARCPHEVLWIEYDNRVRVRVAERLGTLLGPVSDDVSEKVGYLVESLTDNGTIYGVRNVVSIDRKAGPSCFMYTIYTEASPDNMIPEGPRFDGSFLWGLGGQKIPEIDCTLHCVLDPVFAHLKRKNHPAISDVIDKTKEESIGDARFLVAILAMINSVPISSTVTQTGGRRVGRKGRVSAYLGHTTVTIEYPHKEVRLKLRQALTEQAKRRAHMVRGHWRHYKNPERRVWIAPHQRGDASIGFVTHDYNVTAPMMEKR